MSRRTLDEGLPKAYKCSRLEEGTRCYRLGQIKVQLSFSTGLRQCFEGAAGQERLHHAELPDGSYASFVGYAGKEALRETRSADGERHFYDGPQYEETLVAREGVARTAPGQASSLYQNDVW